MIILGIETSCDETAASILKNGKILSNVIISQIIHENYGGVVPALASKNHEILINNVVNEAVKKSNYNIFNLDAIAVTQGPGLIGSLLIGMNYAKGLSIGLGIPLIGVNHLEGHLFSGLIQNNIKYPYLCLLVSGGHTQIWYIKDENNYEIISSTVDDAAGEAFDKGARILGLKYPGGPEIERIATGGDLNSYNFPIPKVKEKPLYFSFSGLKTALLYQIKKMTDKQIKINIHNLAACYQETIINTLLNTLHKAYKQYRVNDILIVGGVSSNKRFRKIAKKLEKTINSRIHFPKLMYCTDNAAMIAMVGYMKYKKKQYSKLNITPYSSIEKY